MLTKALFYLTLGSFRFYFCNKLDSRTLRLSLNIGGDDITEFFYVLLERIKFPYREINLARSYDWNVMEDMKARLCTLAEVSKYYNFSYES